MKNKDLEAYQSGKRSAIVVLGEKFIRLKGCGNLDEGFTIEAMPYPPDTVDVRGCQFFNSVYRELYYTDLIGNILESNQMVSGNKPLGVWKYDFSHSALKNEYAEKIDKYCGIMTTLGDRRLTTHLFQGIDVLIREALGQEQSLTQQHVDELI